MIQYMKDATNTLILTIYQHFIGYATKMEERNNELLLNIKCRMMTDFQWYKDMFLTRIMQKKYCSNTFWKEKFIVGLLHSFAEKVKEKLESINITSYDGVSYDALVSLINKTRIEICNDLKLKKQLKKERISSKKELGQFCEQLVLLFHI
ncbi:hypothetical protein REPUB_Repub12eG0066600 [Reevesia pubescens]